jgi:hypothetical protein
VSRLEEGASYPGLGNHSQAGDGGGGRAGGAAEGGAFARLLQLS